MAAESYAAVPPTDERRHVKRHKAQKWKPQSWWANFLDRSNRGWSMEILSALFGTVLLVTLAIVLRYYDGKPPPQLGSAFGSALTLNTIVSLITTIAKAALLLPVAECVSQQKWMYFARDYHRLSILSSFDNASRGLLGGVALLWNTRPINLASIGALLMVYAIAVDPLSQQLVSSTNRLSASTDPGVNRSATVPQCYAWQEPYRPEVQIHDLNHVYSIQSQLSLPAQSAILAGLYSGNKTVQDVAPVCPGADCTFESFFSLAVCPSFADVTSNLQTRNVSDGSSAGPLQSDVRYYVSNHQFLQPAIVGNENYTAYGNITSALAQDFILEMQQSGRVAFVDTVAYAGAIFPIADFFVIYGTAVDDHNKPTQFKATEILLEWCLQNYTSSVSNGHATTVRHNVIKLDSRALNWFQSNPRSLNFSLPAEASRGANVSPYVDWDSHVDLQDHLYLLLNGSVSRPESNSSVMATNTAVQALFEPFEPFYSRGDYDGADIGMGDGIAATNETGLELLINNLATSLTNHFRTSCIINDKVDQSLGTVLTHVTFTVIRWKWIAVLAGFTILSWLFLLATIAGQRFGTLRGSAWKSSSLAVLHALDPEIQRDLGGLDCHTKMFRRDEERKVRLVCVPGEGWRLLVEPSADVEMDTTDKRASDSIGSLPPTSTDPVVHNSLAR
ncbi:hypothetical protein K461DRAFT_297322 [Myriangium duriaei CBS 260.36]|uniref:Uncharacterized protein n=1 Tax=Myriangium duriaei CBS 260.36 TaxID=1168546 RepID=A0A9P4ISE7_9PEZI|nr:hypothetical protein K461DRAFT_297322 [Myriangium duriaei CBS 260.36]